MWHISDGLFTRSVKVAWEFSVLDKSPVLNEVFEWVNGNKVIFFAVTLSWPGLPRRVCRVGWFKRLIRNISSWPIMRTYVRRWIRTCLGSLRKAVWLEYPCPHPRALRPQGDVESRSLETLRRVERAVQGVFWYIGTGDCDNGSHHLLLTCSWPLQQYREPALPFLHIPLSSIFGSIRSHFSLFSLALFFFYAVITIINVLSWEVFVVAPR